jgi:hypothetical protein
MKAIKKNMILQSQMLLLTRCNISTISPLHLYDETDDELLGDTTAPKGRG